MLSKESEKGDRQEPDSSVFLWGKLRVPQNNTAAASITAQQSSMRTLFLAGYSFGRVSQVVQSVSYLNDLWVL